MGVEQIGTDEDVGHEHSLPGPGKPDRTVGQTVDMTECALRPAGFLV